MAQTVMAPASDENALRKAIETPKNKSLLEQVKEAITQIVKRLKEFFRTVDEQGRAAGHNLQAQPWLGDVKALEQLAERFSEMMAEVRESEARVGVAESEVRFAKKNRPFYKALDSAEWRRFYAAAMKNNQNDAFRIGDNAILLPYEKDRKREYGTFGCKIVIYDTIGDDVPVSAVYNIVNYDYNIHDDTVDTANVLVRLVEDGYNEIDIATTLQGFTDVYGQIFQKYSSSSGKPYSLTRRRVQNGKNSEGKSSGTEVSGNVGEGVSGTEENGQLNEKKSKDDAFAVDKKTQNIIIQSSNPVNDDYHTWIRSADDIFTFDEALKSGRITVYSSYPIRQGVFVTPSKMEAESYSGGGRIYQKRVALSDVAWIDPIQGQYANVREYVTEDRTPVPKGKKSKDDVIYFDEDLEQFLFDDAYEQLLSEQAADEKTTFTLLDTSRGPLSHH